MTLSNSIAIISMIITIVGAYYSYLSFKTSTKKDEKLISRNKLKRKKSIELNSSGARFFFSDKMFDRFVYITTLIIVVILQIGLWNDISNDPGSIGEKLVTSISWLLIALPAFGFSFLFYTIIDYLIILIKKKQTK